MEEGKFELSAKTSSHFDSTAQHPDWLGGETPEELTEGQHRPFGRVRRQRSVKGTSVKIRQRVLVDFQSESLLAERLIQSEAVGKGDLDPGSVDACGSRFTHVWPAFGILPRLLFVTVKGMPTDSKKLDELCINTIRILAADAVQNANSGHPGMPMGAAAMAYTLWSRYLKFNPKDPGWFDRDRFVPPQRGHGLDACQQLAYGLRVAPHRDTTFFVCRWSKIKRAFPPGRWAAWTSAILSAA